MKKKLLILTICLLAVAIIACFAACSEKTDRKPVATDVKGATVSDNGGMAVRYGNYVYFINGFAGETALNTFGDVVRGAICRATLKDGVPDYKSVEIIVPKNAFGEDKTYGGIYIVDGYIYYNTTSVDKNASREYKSTQGVLTRTSIDGSKTEILKELDDNDIVLYAGDNSKYLCHVYDSYAYSINSANKEVTLLSKANGKNPTDEKQTVTAYKFAGDYLVYTMYNYADESNYSADYVVWVFDLKTGKHTQILNSDIYNGNTERKTLYTTTIVDIIPSESGFTVYYSKKGNDNGQNDGFYSYTFDRNDPKFDKSKEIRYTHETSVNNYSKFTKLSNGYTLAFCSDRFDLFDANGNKALNENSKPIRLSFEKAVTVLDVIESDTEVYAYYLLDSKFYYIRLFDKNESSLLTASTDAVAFFAGKYNTSYTTYDIIDNIIYYFNDDMEDNAYYYVIPAFDQITAETDKATGKILGKISDKDLMTLIAEEVKDDDDHDGHDHD